MPGIQEWGDVVTSSLQDLWTRFINFLPSLVGAIVIIVIGWIVAIAVGKFVTKIFSVLKVNEALEKLNLKTSLEKAGIKPDLAGALGFLVKWFLILVFILAAADLLKLTQVSEFLNQVLGYLPNVVVAGVILLLGILFASFAKGVVESSLAAAKLTTATIVAGIVKWSILIFSILAALVQLKVAEDILRTLFTGLVAMIALAGGLAFGLGGKDFAQKLLEDLRKDISKKEEE